jgi:hypothetical protein
MMLVYLTRFQLHAPVQIRKLRLRGTKIKNSKEVNEKDPEIESSFLFLGLSFNRNNACDGPSKIKYSKEQIKRKKKASSDHDEHHDEDDLILCGTVTGRTYSKCMGSPTTATTLEV